MRRVTVQGLAIAAQLALVACGHEGGTLGPESGPQPDSKVTTAPAAAGLEADVTALAATADVDVADFNFDPDVSKIAQAGTVQWHFHGPSNHTTTDNSGLQLWDSGPLNSGQSFPFVFTAAGVYNYRCSIHRFMKGKVKVPMKAMPTSGGTSTSFLLTWSSENAVAPYVFDVQVQRPGSSSFEDWQTGVVIRKMDFVPDAGTGVYSFHARLRDTSKAKSSLYSAPKKITVN